MIKAVIFDMDGVIIDSEMEYLLYDLEFAKTKNPEIRLEALFGMVGLSKEGAWTWMADALGNGQTWEALWNDYSVFGSVYDKVDFRQLFRPEVTDLLKTFREYGLKIALASSTGMKIIRRVLQENEIEKYFDVVVSGEQFHKSKPDPEIYHFTAEKLGVKEPECFVVEDSTYGILAASRAGMKIAAVVDERFNFDQSLADFRVERVEEILPLVEREAHIIV